MILSVRGATTTIRHVEYWFHPLKQSCSSNIDALSCFARIVYTMCHQHLMNELKTLFFS